MQKSHKAAMAWKENMVSEIRDKFSRSKIVILTDYRGPEAGLSVKDMSSLRRKMREQQADFQVVKNTMAVRVINEMNAGGLEPYLENPTALVFAFDDPTQVAKVLLEFAREKKTPHNEFGLPIIKAAFIEGRIIDAQKVRDLASLPPRSVLLQQIMGLMLAPHQRLMGSLTGAGRKMLNFLDALRREREKQG